MSTDIHSSNRTDLYAGGSAQPDHSDLNHASTSDLPPEGLESLSDESKHPSESEPTADAIGLQLELNVSKLWADSKNRAKEDKLNSAETKKVKLALHAELSNLKYHLVKAGRDGRWRGFLKEAVINRASADRWVNKHRELTEPPTNCLHEASTLTEAELGKLARDCAKKLIKRLRTREQVTVFVAKLSAFLSSSLAPPSDLSGH